MNIADNDKVEQLLTRAVSVGMSVPDSTRSRIDASVVRPLTSLLGRSREMIATSQVVDVDKDAARRSYAVWELAEEATVLYSTIGSVELFEAAAALQDLACGATESESMGQERLRRLGLVNGGGRPTIQLSPDGPLLVRNVTSLVNWLGEPLPSRPLMALCRCGASHIKPFCDGGHAQTAFCDSKDPGRFPDRQDKYVGEQLAILDNRGTCQHSGYCTDRLPTVFHSQTEPFVTPSGGRMDEMISAVRDCPSGALSLAMDGIQMQDLVNFHDMRAPAIEVSKDGPYRIKGAIALLDAEGRDVPRNEGASREHFALCRCGHARNKPFCTGMHWYVQFRDPVRAADDATPTIFEWAGGLPALLRMTRIFYEKYVPQDDLLAPLFAEMSPDHPERVAKWLSEVFSGPQFYSKEYGGYPRMLSQHLGKCITEEMRARWVSLMLQAAKDAGLPNDAEFASAFQAYIAWGSRLAVENSQTNAKPPEDMPMPHWGWSTAAGPPGSRASALASGQEEEEEAAVLPGPGDVVTFSQHVKPLFRQRDRLSMQFAFDLWSHADVSKHAKAILERLRNGSMPCDRAWPPERIDVFERWIAAGQPE
jgi:CDGSH-type Zn-finger protein/truncated hemoglobin YjbI/ferredoxin